jgi:hypothetical protein
MNARNKLNIAFFQGSLLIAGLLGLALRSCSLFVVALIALVLVNLYAGNIRPNKRR